LVSSKEGEIRSNLRIITLSPGQSTFTLIIKHTSNSDAKHAILFRVCPYREVMHVLSKIPETLEVFSFGCY